MGHSYAKHIAAQSLLARMDLETGLGTQDAESIGMEAAFFHLVIFATMWIEYKCDRMMRKTITYIIIQNILWLLIDETVFYPIHP